MATSKRLLTSVQQRKGIYVEERDDQERPCLHCMMGELIDDFFAEYPRTLFLMPTLSIITGTTGWYLAPRRHPPVLWQSVSSPIPFSI